MTYNTYDIQNNNKFKILNFHNKLTDKFLGNYLFGVSFKNVDNNNLLSMIKVLKENLNNKINKKFNDKFNKLNNKHLDILSKMNNVNLSIYDKSLNIMYSANTKARKKVNLLKAGNSYFTLVKNNKQNNSFIMKGGVPPFTQDPTVLKNVIKQGTRGIAEQNIGQIVNKNLRKNYNNSLPNQDKEASFHNSFNNSNGEDIKNINDPKYKLGDLIWKRNMPEVVVEHSNISDYDYSTEYFTEMEALSGIGLVTWMNHEKKLIMFNDFSDDQKLTFMRKYKEFSELLEGISSDEDLTNVKANQSKQIVKNIVNNTPLEEYKELNYLPAFREMSDFFVNNDLE
jgi:hypothetical protein